MSEVWYGVPREILLLDNVEYLAPIADSVSRECTPPPGVCTHSRPDPPELEGTKDAALQCFFFGDNRQNGDEKNFCEILGAKKIKTADQLMMVARK